VNPGRATYDWDEGEPPFSVGFEFHDLRGLTSAIFLAFFEAQKFRFEDQIDYFLY
jgi:hypothetical protein